LTTKVRDSIFSYLHPDLVPSDNFESYKQLVRVTKNRTVLDYYLNMYLFGSLLEPTEYLLQTFSERQKVEKQLTMLVEFNSRLIHLDIVNKLNFCFDFKKKAITEEDYKCHNALLIFDLTSLPSFEYIVAKHQNLPTSGCKGVVGVHLDPTKAREVTTHIANVK
jgi:hypothetical protein